MSDHELSYLKIAKLLDQHGKSSRRLTTRRPCDAVWMKCGTTSQRLKSLCEICLSLRSTHIKSLLDDNCKWCWAAAVSRLWWWAAQHHFTATTSTSSRPDAPEKLSRICTLWKVPDRMLNMYYTHHVATADGPLSQREDSAQNPLLRDFQVAKGPIHWKNWAILSESYERSLHFPFLVWEWDYRENWYIVIYIYRINFNKPLTVWTYINGSPVPWVTF